MTENRIIRPITPQQYEEKVNSFLREGYKTQSNNGQRCVLYREPGYGNILAHIALLFLFPIIGNLILIAIARTGPGERVTIELREWRETK